CARWHSANFDFW
nr:immunoglobulin heavy chain junction region [Macaca mulatta]MOV48313.1 immunoglobulin heavy chain junction region [Macaca mulatta]